MKTDTIMGLWLSINMSSCGVRDKIKE
jgi:hypothetical protein